MFNRIQKFINNQEHKILFKNFLALSVLQATNFILPLITLPYIIKNIGTEKFGILNIAQAIATYFVVFTEYGFNLSATRDVSVHRNDTEKLSRISSNVFITKFVLCFVSLFILGLLVAVFPKFRAETTLFFCSFTIVIGQALLPVWFFQGIEQMKFITYLNLISKVIFTILIFIIVKQPTDYIYIVLLGSLGNIISGVIGIWIMFKKFDIQFYQPKREFIIKELREGWYIFASNFSNIIYTNSNIIILGIFTNNLVVGYYSIAEKVIIAIKQILIVFSQAIYPKICKLSLNDHSEIILFLKKIFLPFLAGIFFICCLLLIFAPQIVYFLSGKYLVASITLMQLFSFVPFIIALNIPPYQTLLAYNLKKSYSTILTIGAIINVALNLFLASNFQALGTVITVLSTEAFITLGLYIVLELRYSKYSLFSMFAVRPNPSARN